MWRYRAMSHARSLRGAMGAAEESHERFRLPRCYGSAEVATVVKQKCARETVLQCLTPSNSKCGCVACRTRYKV
jgi:hypothetical protein